MYFSDSRLVTWFAYGEDVWKWGASYDDDYFFWVPWLLPHIGALFGACVYLVFISMHHERGPQKRSQSVSELID